MARSRRGFKFNAFGRASVPRDGFAVVHRNGELYGSHAIDRGLPDGSLNLRRRRGGIFARAQETPAAEQAGAPGAAASRRSVTMTAV